MIQTANTTYRVRKIPCESDQRDAIPEATDPSETGQKK